jgi:hypothetical protein
VKCVEQQTLKPATTYRSCSLFTRGHTGGPAETPRLLSRRLFCCAAERFAALEVILLRSKTFSSQEVILLYWKANSSAANVFASQQRDFPHSNMPERKRIGHNRRLCIITSVLLRLYDSERGRLFGLPRDQTPPAVGAESCENTGCRHKRQRCLGGNSRHHDCRADHMMSKPDLARGLRPGRILNSLEAPDPKRRVPRQRIWPSRLIPICVIRCICGRTSSIPEVLIQLGKPCYSNTHGR